METPQDCGEVLSQLQARLVKIKVDQNEADESLSNFTQEHGELVERLQIKEPIQPSGAILKHYRYILPLVKEIHHIELKIKDKQKEYERRKMENQFVQEQNDLLTDCLPASYSTLKMWSESLRQLRAAHSETDKSSTTPESSTVSNVTYSLERQGENVLELLGFTVLCQHVHIQVMIKATSLWPCVHVGRPQPLAVGVKSDTFVPGLKEAVVSAYRERRSVTELVALLAEYITQDMAPFVIVCPMKKVKKKKKTKINDK
ncbi:uncharacterized protein LOC101855552 [Aplysia californica]|uniref:Uncharacterized protein LOC101855552 n=1 Tax=Aplysia californica TaxID=6500 RepID=A0ABM0JJX7_APLCA|nr:uncharacterized protein LOC101855552 [Aplysia californica]